MRLTLEFLDVEVPTVAELTTVESASWISSWIVNVIALLTVFSWNVVIAGKLV